MAIKQMSVFVDNRKGALAGMLKLLADNHIDLRALSIADTADFGILRFIADDNKKAAEILAADGHICAQTDVVAACLNDQPGALAAQLAVLADANIDVEYLYAFVTTATNQACVVLRVADNAAAEAALTAAGVQLLTEADIAAL